MNLFSPYTVFVLLERLFKKKRKRKKISYYLPSVDIFLLLKIKSYFFSPQSELFTFLGLYPRPILLSCKKIYYLVALTFMGQQCSCLDLDSFQIPQSIKSTSSSKSTVLIYWKSPIGFFFHYYEIKLPTELTEI